MVAEKTPNNFRSLLFMLHLVDISHYAVWCMVTGPQCQFANWQNFVTNGPIFVIFHC